ncbi:uncharacterized protein LOC112598786 [Melanaphis sacchari]|uniref:uncharacterized protein LOC112598786 n=1 Tax=Melanaphis sacchari TaxID=742174 RepID=UPI000DC14B47|nr:uncharacterized protein LOC112598786 [Melanaphis sacchari]
MTTDNKPLVLKQSLKDSFTHFFLKKLSKVVVTIIIIALLIYYYWKFTWIVTENENSRISMLLYTTYVTLNIALIIVCFFNIFMGHDIYKSFTKNIAYVDFLSKNLELSYKDSIITYINFKTLLLIITTTASYIILYHLALNENDFPSVDFTEMVCIPIVWILILQINAKLNQLAKRFNYIKNILEAYMEKSKSIYCIQWYTVRPKDITVLNRMHLFTYISFTEVCSYYNIQLLVLVPRVIFFNVLPVHYNIVTALIADERNASHTWSQIFTLSIIILTIWPIIHLVKSTSNTFEKGAQITQIIHKLLDMGQKQDIEDELYLFSEQLLKRPLEFSVKGFFIIKPSLVASMMELIITYVIILLQFQDSLKSISPAQFLVKPRPG